MDLVLIAQIIGYVAIIEGIFIFISKNREKILVLKFLSDLLWAVNHFLLQAFTGALLFIIGMFREVIFYLRSKYKWADSKFWLVLFLVLSLISPIITWQGPVSLLPATGTIFAVFGFYNKKALKTKYLNIIGQTLWLIYGLCILNFQNAFSSFLGLISLVLGIINEKTNIFEKKK